MEILSIQSFYTVLLIQILRRHILALIQMLRMRYSMEILSMQSFYTVILVDKVLNYNFEHGLDILNLPNGLDLFFVVVLK